ncbi:hypothetical protein IAW_05762 [Bacillus cereus str. Schrouff]|nr:hypothetical protein IAW_05762 [Bacillus cereus str. Schrouff]EOO81722.1 hypothetical protein IGY_05744 [Bacillus cereus K-5975c]
MTKFTSEDKMNAYIHYQNGNESIKDIVKSFDFLLYIWFL